MWPWLSATSTCSGTDPAGESSAPRASAPTCGPFPWVTTSPAARQRREGLCRSASVHPLGVDVVGPAPAHQGVAADGHHGRTRGRHDHQLLVRSRTTSARVGDPASADS